VTKALAIDRSLPIAHSVLAGLHLIDQRYDEAIASSAMAIALDPNSAESYVMQSYVLTKTGRHEEAEKNIDMAYRLNPHAPPYYYFYRAEVQFNLRKYAECIRSIKIIGSTIPDWQLSYDLVPSYAYLGRLDAARAELEKILEVQPNIDIEQLEKPTVFLYKLEGDIKHRIEGFRKAGLSQKTKVLERNMEDLLVNIQSVEEIKALSIGRKWSGFDPKGGGQWWIHFADDGKLPTQGAWGTENGSYWIEDNRICWNWQIFNQVQGGCGFVYRNPIGTVEEKNEYEWIGQFGIYPFSVED